MTDPKTTILITGASSYVGARIFFDLKNKYDLIGTYFKNPLSKSFIELDLFDKETVNKVFKETNPNIIIHVANYPSPKSAINNEENFIKLNGKATEYVIEAANIIGAKVIFISSQAANNPNDLYGKLKVESENKIKQVKAGYLVLRPSLMVGFSPNTTNPRPFNRILRCLDDRAKISEFDTSWKLQPSYVGHLSEVIDKAIQGNIWNKTIPVFINEVVTQYKIAHDILSHFGVSVNQIDQHINIRLSPEDLKEMNSLNLSSNSYQDMINIIVKEIKNRDKFKL